MTTRSIVLLGLALAGCTTASTRMVSDNVAVISASDLSTDSPKAVRKQALVSAAKLAQAKGYPYFAVVAVVDRSASRQDLMRGQIAAPGQQQNVDYVPTRDLTADLTVRFLRATELPANRDGVYDAAAVLSGRLPN